MLFCLLAAALAGWTDDAERDALLKKADASVAAAAKKATFDAQRPTYHVMPAANWLNDPNGPLFHDGVYHLFFQHNPYGDAWGHMHWAHVRSKDLVNWERLPIALWPSLKAGEEHVFSGSAGKLADGTPILFYTSIGKRLPEQWAAIPEDKDLLKWKKHPANPILTEKHHGATKVWEWSDPYFFRHEGKAYLVVGGNLNETKGGKGCVELYEAEDPSLAKWKHRGTLFVHPDKEAKNIECPIFFALGGKHVLLTSAYRTPEYFVGKFEPKAGKFLVESRGTVDPGAFYAPSTLVEDDGRCVMWGWIRDFRNGMGWNGCLTLPRVLSLSPGGKLMQTPLPKLATLRDKSVGPTDMKVDAETPLELGGPGLEFSATIALKEARAAGVTLRRSGDGMRAVRIKWDGKELDVSGTKVPAAGPTLDLRVYVDGMVTEVYAGGLAVSRVFDAKANDTGFAVWAEDGAANFDKATLWTLKSIWKE
ncbi:MAG TPA: glycoside hydrolase family 32 protein [Planctomycetia bacterium]|nr:glycoside hydrolase family 32 protein [Planctomycetia bacterium]